MHRFCMFLRENPATKSRMFMHLHQKWNSGINNPFNVTTFLNKNKSSTPENANDLYFAPYNSCLKGQSTPLPKRQCGAYQPGPRWPLDHHLSTQRRRFLHLGLLCENSVAKKSNTRHWERKCKPHDIGCMIKWCTMVLLEVRLSLV